MYTILIVVLYLKTHPPLLLIRSFLIHVHTSSSPIQKPKACIVSNCTLKSWSIYFDRVKHSLLFATTAWILFALFEKLNNSPLSAVSLCLWCTLLTLTVTLLSVHRSTRNQEKLFTRVKNWISKWLLISRTFVSENFLNMCIVHRYTRPKNKNQTTDKKESPSFVGKEMWQFFFRLYAFLWQTRYAIGQEAY